MRANRTMLLAVGSVFALVLAACASGDADRDEGDAAAAGEQTIAVVDTDLGPIVVDAEGRTLYVFLPDDQGASTCYDDCAANWAALTVEGDPVGGDGVDAALLGTTEREDGTVQVTYGRWPLYRFAGDAAAGDVNGQGVGDV